MPLYRYVCSKCGAEKVEMRSIENRDTPLKCDCGDEMHRVITPPSSIEIKTVTGYSKIFIGDTVIYKRKHRNWTPPKEFLKKKMPSRIF